MKHIYTIISISLICSFCTDLEINQKPLTTDIIELESFKRFVTLDGKPSINLTFLVRSQIKKSMIDSTISKFVRQNIDAFSTEFSQIGLSFYKESKITNEKNLRDNPRDLDRYSQENDLLWVYNWNKEKSFMTRTKFKNGKIVNSKSNIRVTDIDSPKH